MSLVLDPERPPCPWCLQPLGVKEVKRHGGWSYCRHCYRCVVKYLSQTMESGVLGAGWYWGKHQGHEGR